MVRIHIKTLDGAVNLPLEVYLTIKIEEIMLLIKQHTSVELADQKLIFINTVLEPARTLIDYRMQGEDVIHLILGANVSLTNVSTGILVEKNRLLGMKVGENNAAFRKVAPPSLPTAGLMDMMSNVPIASIVVRDRLGVVTGCRESQKKVYDAEKKREQQMQTVVNNNNNNNIDNDATPEKQKVSQNEDKSEEQQTPIMPIAKGDFIADRLMLPPVVAAGRPVPFINFFIVVNVAGTKLRCKFYPRLDDNPSLNILQHIKDQILLHFGLSKRHKVSIIQVELDDKGKTRVKLDYDEDLLNYPNATRFFFAEIDVVTKFSTTSDNTNNINSNLHENPTISIDTSRSIGKGTMTESFACVLTYAPPPTMHQQQMADVSFNHLGSNSNTSPSGNNNNNNNSAANFGNNNNSNNVRSPSSMISPLPPRDHPHSGPAPPLSSSMNYGNASSIAILQKSYLNNNNTNSFSSLQTSLTSVNIPTPFDPPRYIAKRLYCFDPHDAGYLLDEKKKIAEVHEASLVKLKALQPHPNLLFPVGRICQEVVQRFRGVEKSIGEATVYIIYPRYEQSLANFLPRIGTDPFPAMALTIVRKVIAGLNHLHHFDTVHGSVTPKNILFQFNSPGSSSALITTSSISLLQNAQQQSTSQQQKSGLPSSPVMISSPSSSNSLLPLMNSIPSLQLLDVRLTDWYQPELLARHGTGSQNNDEQDGSSNNNSPSSSSSSSKLNHVAPELREIVDPLDRKPTKASDLWQLGIVCLQLVDSLEIGQYQCAKVQSFVDEKQDFQFVSSSQNQKNNNNNVNGSGSKNDPFPQQNGLIDDSVKIEENEIEEDVVFGPPSDYQYRGEKEFFRHDASLILVTIAEGLLRFDPSKREIRCFQ